MVPNIKFDYSYLESFCKSHPELWWIDLIDDDKLKQRILEAIK